MSCEKTAVLHGGFLLAEKQYRPKELSALKKCEWESIGRPVLQAVQEIVSGKSNLNQMTVDASLWERKIICLLWTKLLEIEHRKDEEEVDKSWREDPSFSVQNILPNINHTILYELVKTMGYSRLFVEFLMSFPAGALCAELARLVDHVLQETSEADVQFFLDIWWELWKWRKSTDQDELVQIFAAQVARYASGSSEISSQASKRFKLDPDVSVPSCVVSLLLDALSKMKDCVTSFHLCCLALSNCLDTVYTTFLFDSTHTLSTEAYLQCLSRVVQLRGPCQVELDRSRAKEDQVETIKEAQREVVAAHSPSFFKPEGITLIQSVKALLELFQTWRELLKISGANVHGYAAHRLKGCLTHAMNVLEGLLKSETLSKDESQLVREFTQALTALLEGISLPDLNCDSAAVVKVATTIIDKRLEKFGEVSHVFASKVSWVSDGNDWIGCLERNQDVFRDNDLVLKLVSTLIAKCLSDTGAKEAVGWMKLKGIILDIFTELPLLHKNTVLAGLLSTCGGKGLCGVLPETVTGGFGEELNLAFNCITQSQAQQKLDGAVSAIARVALQNPEAVLRRACHLAVFNLGAHKLLAQILKHLPGLIHWEASSLEGSSSSGCSLLCSCLKGTVWGKLSSAREENQFLEFLVSLMGPSQAAGDSLESGPQLLQPTEVTRAFVLPHVMDSACSVELCLRILQTSLQQKAPEGSDPWVMTCSPFPLLFSLCQLLDSCSQCWQEPTDNILAVSLETKDLLTDILAGLGEVVGREVSADPNTWSRALFWLYNKVEALDWTVRFRLKGVWGNHFKNEVPLSMFAVCDLPEDDWAALALPTYGPGTGLLAWMECCCLSADTQELMLDILVVNVSNAEEVNMFSKGFMVALIQILPWCTAAEWRRLVVVAEQLLQRGILHVPYSLEYIEFMPLLNLRPFTCDLQLSMLLLRAFQLLCSSSCSHWLPQMGWLHVGRLYASAVRGIVESLKGKVPSPASSPPKVPASGDADRSQEAVFVLLQLFCHLLHVLVMMPADTYESLYLASLEILAQYEAVLRDHPTSASSLDRSNSKHFLNSIAQNLPSEELRCTVQQKISML
ncbi:GEMI4 protein, partial [Amia calva]|nr:GEMI4 protein [Amia calva]